MRIGLRGCLAALALFVGACFDGEELTEGLPCIQNSNCGGQQLCVNGFCGGEEVQQGGDPCESGGNVCLDGNTLGVCNLADMTTMEVSCEDSCDGSGFSSSLGCRSSTGSKHQCYCEQESATCTTATCSGSLAILCDGNDFDITDCDEQCQATGQVGTCETDYTTGIPSCTCSSATCYDGATFCQDDNTEVRCVGGVWQPQSCSDAACHMTQCPYEGACVEGYQGQTLGCGYDGSDLRCRCTT